MSDAIGLGTVTVIPTKELSDTSEMGDRELLITVLSELRALREAHNDMVVKVNTVIEEFAPHIPRITELVDSVANSPVMKMFGGSKRG